MTRPDTRRLIRQHLRMGGRLILFLDYDGTLVPIARVPEEAQPDAALLSLLTDLSHTPAIQTIILSGRPLSFFQVMWPISGLILAGTYGVEIRRDGKVTMRGIEPAQVRLTILRVKAEWERLTDGRSGFLLEDKGLALALHARWAEPSEAGLVLETARAAATLLLPGQHFRVLGGDRFLEVAPATAHKGQAVEWLIDRMCAPGALPVYFGDDDKDEEAFAVIHRRGGLSIGVGPRTMLTHAVERVPSPEIVREWLREFLTEMR